MQVSITKQHGCLLGWQDLGFFSPMETPRRSIGQSMSTRWKSIKGSVGFRGFLFGISVSTVATDEKAIMTWELAVAAFRPVSNDDVRF